MVGNTACCNFHPYSWFAKHELDALHNNMKVVTKKIYISVISGHHRFVIIKELIQNFLCTQTLFPMCWLCFLMPWTCMGKEWHINNTQTQQHFFHGGFAWWTCSFFYTPAAATAFPCCPSWQSRNTRVLDRGHGPFKCLDNCKKCFFSLFQKTRLSICCS